MPLAAPSTPVRRPAKLDSDLTPERRVRPRRALLDEGIKTP